MSKKVKGGQRLRAINILIADYFQMTASKLINRSTNINEVGELIDMVTDVKRFLSGAEEIDIRGAENLQRDLINVTGSLARLENNSIARFATLEMASAHKMQKRNTKVNKTKKILARLLKGERLTVSQMSKEYSINHPLSIMYHLRKKGYVIKSELVGNWGILRGAIITNIG